MPAKRPNYTFAVEWIAYNDEPTFTNVEDIESQVSTMLIADLFGKTPNSVAWDIKLLREGTMTVRFERALERRGRTRK